MFVQMSAKNVNHSVSTTTFWIRAGQPLAFRQRINLCAAGSITGVVSISALEKGLITLSSITVGPLFILAIAFVYFQLFSGAVFVLVSIVRASQLSSGWLQIVKQDAFGEIIQIAKVACKIF